MKKAMVIVWSVVLILLIVILTMELHMKFASAPVSLSEKNGEKIAEIQESDGTIALSVSAVGDCTFGNDPNLPLEGFDQVFRKNKESYHYFFENVKEFFQEDDLTIINFEGVLSDRGEREIKEYAFRGDPRYVNILTSSAIEAANIANNHTYDYGYEAFKQTAEVMDSRDISVFGDSTVVIREINGIRVGLIGTNALYYEGRTNFDKNLEALKSKNPHIIIASFHWGEEKATVPSTIQTELAHRAIDGGADLVIGHHPHVIQGIEKYKGKYIAYSLANFCFGGNTAPADKDTMIFNQVFRFKDGKLIEDKSDSVTIIPCSVSSVSSHNDFRPTPLRDDEFERVKEKIISRCEGMDGVDSVRFEEL